MNSGCCKVSISLGMDIMSFFCKCLILVLAWMSGSRKVLLEGRVVGLYVVSYCCLLRGGWRLLVSKVQIMICVFLRMYGFLEMKCLWMNEIDFSHQMLVLLGVCWMSWSVGIVGLVFDLQFCNILPLFLLRLIFFSLIFSLQMLVLLGGLGMSLSVGIIGLVFE